MQNVSYTNPSMVPPPKKQTIVALLLIIGVGRGDGLTRTIVFSRRLLCNAQAWLLYGHARNLSAFHDMHAAMAFAAMANGVEDDAESDLWRSRAEGLLLSMGEYVSSGGIRPPPPPPPPLPQAENSYTDAEGHRSTPASPSSSTIGAHCPQMPNMAV